MAMHNGADPHTSTAHDDESYDHKQAALTRWEGGSVARPVVSAPLPRPVVRRRRLFRITSILLLILLVFATVRLSAILSATDDALLVRIGSQQSSTVDLRQAFPISPFLFGANVFPASGTSSVDQNLSGFMSYGPAVTSGLRNSYIKLLNFPGGGWGQDHLLSYDQLDSFGSLLSRVGASGMVQTFLAGPAIANLPNLTSLQERANLAGQWVDYMNNPHSILRTGKYAHAPFHPIQFWTVGNEPDRLLNPDTGKTFTAAEYTNAFIQFSLSMHQNDPAIQVFGPELSQFYGVGLGPRDATGNLWTETFLKGVADYEKAHPNLKFHLLDGVSFHRYPLGDASVAPGILLGSVDEWNYELPALRQLIRETFGRDIPVAVTEINSNPTSAVPTPGLAALWWADSLGTLMSQEVQYVAFFSAEGVSTPDPFFTTTLKQTQMLRVMQMFAHLQHNVIPVGGQRDPISLYATEDDPHQTVSLLFVNKSFSIQSAQVSVQNQFFGYSPWPTLNVSLFGYSLVLLTLHRNGGADAYSYKVPTSESNVINPLGYAICGHDPDVLSNDRPC